MGHSRARARATQIYETQLKELSTQTQSLSADVGAKEGLLQEARDIINSKVGVRGGESGGGMITPPILLCTVRVWIGCAISLGIMFLGEAREETGVQTKKEDRGGVCGVYLCVVCLCVSCAVINVCRRQIPRFHIHTAAVIVIS